MVSDIRCMCMSDFGLIKLSGCLQSSRFKHYMLPKSQLLVLIYTKSTFTSKFGSCLRLLSLRAEEDLVLKWNVEGQDSFRESAPFCLPRPQM